MISAEAPVLFAKAAEIFIHELTMRAWIHTEDNKRRTLQRNDIAMAITKYDQFDFLIDIVPRDDIKPTPTTSSSKQREDSSVRMAPDQVSYYFQMAQQQQQQQQASTPQIVNPTVRYLLMEPYSSTLHVLEERKPFAIGTFLRILAPKKYLCEFDHLI